MIGGDLRGGLERGMGSIPFPRVLHPLKGIVEMGATV